MKDVYQLNLNDKINPKETALVGRDKGENTLEQYKKSGILFKWLETEYKKINVTIPERIVSMNKSFFLGLFETRVQELGKDAFIEKYKFITSEHIHAKILKNIDAALLTASQAEILNV